MKKNEKKLRYKRTGWYKKKWMQVGHFYRVHCKECHEPLLYYYKYDADCCPICDEWRQKKCSDPDCTFCIRRPEYPSVAFIVDMYNEREDIRRKWEENFANKEKRRIHMYRERKKIRTRQEHTDND